jgi:hypothetical protein
MLALLLMQGFMRNVPAEFVGLLPIRNIPRYAAPAKFRAQPEKS